jgi:hypothetical protein
VYYETAAFDVYLRRGSFGRSKYRIRRYGSSGPVYLDRKLKTSDKVTKRRSSIELSGLHRLEQPAAERGWAGHWFHRRVLARDLHPVCQISYVRTALEGIHEGEPFRLTLDDHVRAFALQHLAFYPGGAGEPVGGRHGILELKYRHALPPLLAELVAVFELVPRRISKYRLAVPVLGFAVPAASPALRRLQPTGVRTV